MILVFQLERHNKSKTVKESGLEAWYMLAENEGHGFRKKENIDQYQNAMVQFLQKNLVGESA